MEKSQTKAKYKVIPPVLMELEEHPNLKDATGDNEASLLVHHIASRYIHIRFGLWAICGSSTLYFL